MKFKKIIAFICLLAVTALFFCGCQNINTNVNVSIKNGDYADVYVTTGTMSKMLARQTSLVFSDYTEDDDLYGVSVTVNLENVLQDFYGYGATLTHASAYLLEQEGAESVASEVLEELFGENGARMNMIRIPIGASDYVETNGFFTCDDLSDRNGVDPTLAQFSLEHDVHLISVLKKIVAINPDVQIIACPWSAPAWMKNTGSLLGGELIESCYGYYADYLVKFVESYKAEGINISYLSLINEPMIHNIDYPHMTIDEYQALEIGQMVNDRLNAKSLNVKLLGWDHNVNDTAIDYVNAIFEEEDTRDVFAGVAFHGYSDVNLATVAEGTDYVKENFSDKLVFLTEITEHSGSNDFANNLAYAARYTTLEPLNHGLNASLFWNYVLRSDGSPTPVSHGNECYGVLDLDCQDGEFYYSKRSGYYAMAHVSKFAYAINGVYPKVLESVSSNDSQIQAVALYRADGAIVISAVNISDQLSETVHFVINGKKVSFELQPQSVVTVVC